MDFGAFFKTSWHSTRDLAVAIENKHSKAPSVENMYYNLRKRSLHQQVSTSKVECEALLLKGLDQ